jgi:VWFA-related protein
MKVFAAVAALLLLQSQQTAPTFLETLEVRITNVDVVVTDRDGKAVRGLHRDDFTVLESGAPQTITNFAEYNGSKGVAEAAVTPAAPAAAPESNAPPQRKFLFFIDDMSLSGRTQKQLIDAATALVRSEMRPGDEAMVITHAKGAKVAQELTADRALVEKRLRDALEQQSQFRANTTGQADEFFIQSFRPSTPQEYLQYQQMARIYATRVNRRVTSTLRTMLGLVGSLNQTSGRKVLVVLSESLPSEPGREAYGLQTMNDKLVPTAEGFPGFASGAPESAAFDPGATAANASWFDVRPMIRELGARASANGVTIYTLQPDVAGAVKVSGGGADVGRGRPSPQGQSARAGTFAVDQFHRSVVAETRDTLQTLADDTGGKFFIGAREVSEGFRQIADDLTSYYSLGYRSEGAGDNGVRKIEVRVKNRPELVVRARREILRRSPDREMDEIVAANLIMPRTVNELDISATAGKPEYRVQNYRVPVVVKIPLSKLTFIPYGDKYRGAFSVHYAAADGADFTTGTYREQTLEIPAAEIDAARARVFTYTAILTVAPGTLRVAVGVYDKYSHLAGFQQLEVVAK